MNNKNLSLALEKGLNPATLSTGDKWERPTGQEVRLVLEIIGDPNNPGKPATGSQVAQYLGLADGRAVRNWLSRDVQRSSISYAAWALLCYRAGLGLIVDE